MSQLNIKEKELFLEYQSIIRESLKNQKEISFGEVKIKSKLLDNDDFLSLDDINIIYELSKIFKITKKIEIIKLDGVAGKREKTTGDYFFNL